MQHNKSGRKLGRKSGHRLAMFSNQLASLFIAERIVTTLPKAKELRPLAERIVTQGKRGTVHARRLVGRWIQSRDVIQKLFVEIAPRFSERPGGYLRIVKLGPRKGDGAEMAVLEFVDFQMKKKAAPSPASEGKAAKGKGKDGAPEGAGEESTDKPKKAPKKAAEKRPAAQKGAAKSAPKAKPTKSPTAPKKTSAPKKTGGA